VNITTVKRVLLVDAIVDAQQVFARELLAKGLMFVTTREVNILDTNTGKLLWENSIEAGVPFNSDKPRPFPTATKNDKLYVFSAKESTVFEIDKVNATSKKMTVFPGPAQRHAAPRYPRSPALLHARATSSAKAGSPGRT